MLNKEQNPERSVATKLNRITAAGIQKINYYLLLINYTT
jgi:hypothetical protein